MPVCFSSAPLRWRWALGFLGWCLLWVASAAAQSGSTLQGRVVLERDDRPVSEAVVTIIELRRSAMTDENGNYRFENVPPGNYRVFAHLDRIPDVVQPVTVQGPTTLDFTLKLRAETEQVTVTATLREETTRDAIQAVTTVNSFDLAERAPVSLGDALEREVGVAKRSFGPGTGRPVIRGFDGDRVLVTQDGLTTGSIGFQSGDHAEIVDLQGVERLEVVKGPATLLYGSTAVGGVVNAVTGNEESHPGLQGYVTAFGGTGNALGGGSGGVKYGRGPWMVFANGGGQRAGDYRTPLGVIENSFARSGNASGGGGYYGQRGFFNVAYTYAGQNYGVPPLPDDDDDERVRERALRPKGGEPGELVRLNPRRHGVRFLTGARNLDTFFTDVQVQLQYNRYRHDEIKVETNEVETAFRNDTFAYRILADHRPLGRFQGTWGASGLYRDYSTRGEELLTPATTQTNFAFFGLEKVTFERAALQFGGRIERNAYAPTGGNRARSFTGFSGGVGLRVGLWENGALTANYTHSYRAPALEELYNFGPHPGTLLFEIGDANLSRELTNGIEVSVRHQSRRVRASAGFYYYDIRSFVFPVLTGEFEDGLPVGVFTQGDARFLGTEAQLDINLHPNLWFYSQLDYTNAELKTGLPLPRIPPLRARVALEGTFKGLRLMPELLMANRQDRVFTLEEPTAGYTVVNLVGSYTVTTSHTAHVFSVTGFNLGDRLYRNHLSFIKAFAPEIGRGVRFAYTMRFF
ncbi:TonB-dependent receptor [Chloracidobacterium aggregatum]|uniref:TonB-dependent receptor n=1 Tax=Chloracidobacterium sp. N TaxID=2821540 RepID=A0ABX8B120_9BACT|nr:TonB-dependent receptor [Chloracidobacterium aggregatum]QUV85006.1 TonB-dependent receptor [Chloracidobacterium sp. 2]QUV88590.1 TonB-dependent receptor [Chloracidobacterium sp. S]QUV91511.1 TonB-dependent receptor [Chloracidobacterium sp. A]QUV94689.1 TonB-dependent receptor [Chloracidobacterium sp. N]QUV97892.1 TonB-dependent receptor [Chloracidobacterium sp. E]